MLVKGARHIAPVDIKTPTLSRVPYGYAVPDDGFAVSCSRFQYHCENVFENRFQVVDELKRMEPTCVEGHTAVVEGARLLGAKVRLLT